MFAEREGGIGWGKKEDDEAEEKEDENGIRRENGGGSGIGGKEKNYTVCLLLNDLSALEKRVIDHEPNDWYL